MLNIGLWEKPRGLQDLFGRSEQLFDSIVITGEDSRERRGDCEHRRGLEPPLGPLQREDWSGTAPATGVASHMQRST